ncbi:NaeI family type II restriction endonuclease [Streptomyces sp. INA 01156]
MPHKTERPHAGTFAEANLQRKFKFTDGHAMDYRITDAEVDCKCSQKFGGWILPCQPSRGNPLTTTHAKLGVIEHERLVRH